MLLSIFFTVVFFCQSFFCSLCARWDVLPQHSSAIMRRQGSGQKWAQLNEPKSYSGPQPGRRGKAKALRREWQKDKDFKKRRWWRKALVVGVPSAVALLSLVILCKKKQRLASAPHPEAISSNVQEDDGGESVHSSEDSRESDSEGEENHDDDEDDGAPGFADDRDYGQGFSLPEEQLSVPTVARAFPRTQVGQSRKTLELFNSPCVCLIENPAKETLLYEAAHGEWADVERVFVQTSPEGLLVKDAQGKNVLHYVAERFLSPLVVADDRPIIFDEPVIHFFGQKKNLNSDIVKSLVILAEQQDANGKFPLTYLLSGVSPAVLMFVLLDMRFFLFYFFDPTRIRSCHLNEQESEEVNKALFNECVNFISQRIQKNDTAALSIFSYYCPIGLCVELVSFLITCGAFGLNSPAYWAVLAAASLRFNISRFRQYFMRLMPPALLNQVVVYNNGNWKLSEASPLCKVLRFVVQIIFGKRPDYSFDERRGPETQFSSRTVVGPQDVITQAARHDAIYNFLRACRQNPLDLKGFRPVSKWQTYSSDEKEKVKAMFDRACEVRAAQGDEALSRAIGEFREYMKSSERWLIGAQDEEGKTLAHERFLIPSLLGVQDVNFLIPRYYARFVNDDGLGFDINIPDEQCFFAELIPLGRLYNCDE